MTKIAIIGDCHFGASNSSDIIHDYFEKFYEFFIDKLVNLNIKHCISLGDLFDRRKEIHFNTIFRSNKYFFDRLVANNIQLNCIAGNHDILHNNTSKINSVSLLLDAENIRVVDKVPHTFKFDGTAIDFYPWINSGNMQQSLEFARNSKSHYAVGHFQFTGFPMHPGSIADTGMSHKIFSNYLQVFSGHFHTISQQENILYTGTPCELNFSDCGDPKGFWVFDTESGNFEHIKNPYTLFEKILYTEDLVYDFSQATDKYIKLIVVSKGSQKKFDAFVEKVTASKPHDLKIIEPNITDNVTQAVSITDLVSTQKMITDVVDNMELDLDRSTLKTNILSLYAEAMSINNSL